LADAAAEQSKKWTHGCHVPKDAKASNFIEFYKKQSRERLTPSGTPTNGTDKSRTKNVSRSTSQLFIALPRLQLL
jgi:hypothetical protein